MAKKATTKEVIEKVTSEEEALIIAEPYFATSKEVIVTEDKLVFYPENLGEARYHASRKGLKLFTVKQKSNATKQDNG